MDSNSLRNLAEFVYVMEVLLAAGQGSSLYGIDYMHAAEEARDRGWVSIKKGSLDELELKYRGAKSVAGIVARREDPHATAFAVGLTDEGKTALEKLESFRTSILT